MNKDFTEHAKKIFEDTKKYQIGHWYQDNFTVCTIQDKKGKILSVGASKRNPQCDEWNEERGDTISFIRAVRLMDNGWYDDGEEADVVL